MAMARISIKAMGCLSKHFRAIGSLSAPYWASLWSVSNREALRTLVFFVGCWWPVFYGRIFGYRLAFRVYVFGGFGRVPWEPRERKPDLILEA